MANTVITPADRLIRAIQGVNRADFHEAVKDYIAEKSSNNGLTVPCVARFTYDITGGDDGTIGAHGTGVTLPDNAIVLDGVIDVTDTFTDNDDDSATIAIHVEDADDIVAAVAISDGGNPWDEGLQDLEAFG